MSRLFKTIRIFIPTFCLFLLQTSCRRNVINNDNNIILEVNNVKLSRFEWFKQAKIYVNIYENLHSSPPPLDSVKSNSNEFIDYGYILAGAYEKGYDKSPEVAEKVIATSKYIMCQNGGVLFKKLFGKNANLTDKELLLALNKIRLTSSEFSNTDIEKVKESLNLNFKIHRYNQFKQKKLIEASLKINKNLLNELSQRAQYNNELIIDKQSVVDLLDKELFSYKNSNIIKVKVSKFLDYYNKMLPVRKKMNNKEQYERFIQEQVLSDLMYKDAISLNLTSNPEFLAGQLNFKNKTIADIFKKNELYRKIEIKENEVRKEYEIHKNIFVEPKAVQISIFTFDNFINANSNIYKLNQLIITDVKKPIIDTFLIKGLQKTEFHKKISSFSNLYGSKTISQIFSMLDKTISGPFLINNRILVFKKERNLGTRIKTFNEVENQIRTVLIKREESKILKNYLKEAKEKYICKNYFNTDDYLLPVNINLENATGKN